MTPVEKYIREQAALRGMDPDKIIEGVMTEGGVNDPFRPAEGRKNGVLEPSYGPFQMLIGGEGTGYPIGLGNAALARGIDPRKDWQGSANFALDTIAQEGWGQWYGPKNAGLGRWHGVNRGSSKPMGTTLNSIGNPGGYASEGPMGEAFGRAAPPLPAPRTIQDRPIGTPAPAMTTDPGNLEGIKGLLAKMGGGESGEAGNFAALADAFGGGGSGGAPQIQPSSIGPAVSNEIAAKAASAQQMMAALMASKRRKRAPGLSMMG